MGRWWEYHLPTIECANIVGKKNVIIFWISWLPMVIVIVMSWSWVITIIECYGYSDYPWPWHDFEYPVEYHDHYIIISSHDIVAYGIFPWESQNIMEHTSAVRSMACWKRHLWAVNLQLPPCHVWWASSLPCLIARVSRAGHVKVFLMGKSGKLEEIVGILDLKKWKMCFLEKIVVKLWNMGNIRARMKCVFFLFPMLLKFWNGS